MTKYQKRKECIRAEAIDWQREIEEANYSYGELLETTNYFEKAGRKYGLLTEFRENGIC